MANQARTIAASPHGNPLPRPSLRMVGTAGGLASCRYRRGAAPSWVLLFVVLAVLVIPMTARGGIYNPSESEQGPSLPEWSLRGGLGFKNTFITYRSVTFSDAIEFDNPVRKRYQLVERLYQLVDRKERRANLAKLNMLEKLSLSEYLIRRGDPEEARQVLKPIMSAADSSPVNFLFYCNMATACHLIAESGGGAGTSTEYQEAIYHLGRALKMWPETWDGLFNRPLIASAMGLAAASDLGSLSLTPTLYMSNEPQRALFNLHWDHGSESSTFERCRLAETYYLKLLESRLREKGEIAAAEKKIDATRDPAAKAKLVKALKERKRALTAGLDRLFSAGERSINYVDEQGEFAPGKLAASELVLFPDGKIDQAIRVVQQLLFWLPRDVRLERQLGELYNARGKPGDIAAARDIFYDLVEVQKITENDDLRRRNLVLRDFRIPPEDAGKDIDFETDETKHLKDDIEVLKAENQRLKDSRPPIPISENPPVNWNTIGVTLVFGIAVGVVGLWQVQEIMRRSRRNKPVG